MVDQKSQRPEREEELNQALEALYFAFRAVIAKPDARLSELGFSRVHHRILYFVGRNPGLSVNELLGIMGVSKQYLNRPLRQLTEQGYIDASPEPNDRRMKRLGLTPAGAALENELSGDQRRRFSLVFSEAGKEAEEGWHRIMQLLSESRFD